MWKVTVGLITLAFCLSIVFLTHSVATGIGVPYPDPTQEQAAYERYHKAISLPLFLAATAGWLAAGVSAATSVGQWLMQTKPAKPNAVVNGGER